MKKEDEAELVGQLHINPVHPTLSFALIQTLKWIAHTESILYTETPLAL